MGIAGASRFLGSATLANTQGRAAQSSTVLDNSASGILDAGRRVSASGKGISASARALNQAFLNRSTDINALFSLAVGPNATEAGAAQEILALRSQTNTSQLSRELQQLAAEEAAAAAAASQTVEGNGFSRALPPADPAFAGDVSLLDNGTVLPGENGQAVDTEA